MILPLVVNVLLAILLMLPFIYGQQRYGRFNSLARINEQKALVLYAAVSAAIAVLVLEHPATALVVFGMGGLLRFRTKVAEGGTGRGVYMVVIGLACGLSLYALAVTLTVVGYMIMWRQAIQVPLELTIKKLSPERLEDSMQAYTAALEEYGGRVAATRTSFAGDQFTLVLVLPRRVALHKMNESFKLKISPELQGEPHAATD